jgi:LmbE family N-acetylglucosaminyl deacetylase
VNLVFVVCHPDDEALWAGGMVHGLSQLSDVDVHVVCLSGRDPGSPRPAEFEAARKVAGYAGGVVLGGPLRKATEPLPDIAATTRSGLEALGLRESDVALLVTHPPYGDEHVNPHHVQAYEELLRWTRSADIPFAWFATTAMPHLSHRPVLAAPSRAGHEFHLVGMARCHATLGGVSTRLVRPYLRDRLGTPRWWLQFAGDLSVKARMLDCYQSVEVAAHRRGYASWTNSVEGLYVLDDAGMEALRAALQTMDTPAETDIFRGLQPLRSLTRQRAR